MVTGQVPSWSIRCDFDTGLQFASFIARHLSIDPSATPSLMQQEEVAWRDWWSRLLTNTLQQAMSTIERSLSPSSKAYFTLLQSQLQSTFHPPEFPHLATTPQLQALCREQWPAFQQWWETQSGGKEQLSSQLSAQLHRLKLHQLVARCSKVQRKKQIQPFQLIIEFVHWPSEYTKQLSETILVVGRRYLEANRQEQFRERLTPIIERLV